MAGKRIQAVAQIRHLEKVMVSLKREEALLALKKKGFAAYNAVMTLIHRETACCYTDDPNNPVNLAVIDGRWAILVDLPFETLVDFYRSQNIMTFGVGAVLPHYEEEARLCGCSVLWTEYCHVYRFEGHPFKINLTEGYTLGPLLLEDAETIDAFYTYQGEGTLLEIQRDIEERANVGIRTVQGELVSWVLIHPDGSMGIMFTKPEHRKRGLGATASKALINAQLEKHNIPYVHIVHGNDASIALAISIGMVHALEVMWFEVSF